MSRPKLSNEEFALLSDPDARKKALGDAPLTIKDRTIGGEAHRIDKGAVLNDVHFVNCNPSGHSEALGADDAECITFTFDAVTPMNRVEKWGLVSAGRHALTRYRVSVVPWL